MGSPRRAGVILLDANVLVYAVNADSPQHAASRAILDAALSGDLAGALIPQVLLEFFAVVTNAKRVTAPLAPDIAWQQVTALRAGLPLLDVSPSAFDELDRLMQSVPPRRAGSAVFDLFLAAQIRAHRITTLCTYNTADFASIAGITAVTPEGLRATLAG